MFKVRANESEQDSAVRKARNKQSVFKVRANESEQDSVVRKAKNKQSTSRKRARETEQETAERKTKNRCLMSTVRASAKPIDAIIEEFIAKVKIGPDYVCASCHRMLYKHTVVQFKPSKYTKASSELLEKLSEHACVSNIDGKQWICKTYDGSLSRGVIPTQAKANGMELDDEPDELKSLNALEQRLIALRVPFMKMVALPTGKHKCIHARPSS